MGRGERVEIQIYQNLFHQICFIVTQSFPLFLVWYTPKMVVNNFKTNRFDDADVEGIYYQNNISARFGQVFKKENFEWERYEREIFFSLQSSALISNLCKSKVSNWINLIPQTGADPGFPVGGGANPQGVPTRKFARFSQKLHEITKILIRRGRVQGVPPWIRHCQIYWRW